ncbi:energy transducer TonB [Caulobacter sp. CCUG 60055]|uniref:energy transducer TonB n=1 Tax=Caulobacter sp. CCUG 60055 TaxID=2100090 RepID=UPI001FA72F16|nr:energy transducer TonB [Caulobacter sp. CCUG 60055]
MSLAEIRAMVTAQTSAKPKDPFTKSRDEDWGIGRRFRVVVPLKQTSSDGGPVWAYDPDTEILSADISATIRSSDQVERFGAGRYLIVDSHAPPSKFQIGQTAFGAVAEYQSERTVSLGLFEPSGGMLANTAMSYSSPTPPAEARALTQRLRIVVEGQIVAGTPHRSAFCSSERYAARLDSPVEVIVKRCFVAVRIDRVSLTDSQKTLRYWEALALPARQRTEPRSVENVRWSATPSAEDFERYYPERAHRMERNGQSRLQCIVRGEGRLEGCTVVSESPQGFGFGEAALRLSRRYMADVSAGSDVTEGDTVTFQLDFAVPGA